MPARHIIIESAIYKEKRASYGTIWAYRLWYVLPPTSDDGICHQCLALRNHIAQIHREIPQTDPKSDEGKRQENTKHHLVLQKNNEYPLNSEVWIELIRSKFDKLKPSEQSVLKWRLESRLVLIRKLEHHFRLQKSFLKGKKNLPKTFLLTYCGFGQTSRLLQRQVKVVFTEKKLANSHTTWHQSLSMVLCFNTDTLQKPVSKRHRVRSQ